MADIGIANCTIYDSTLSSGIKELIIVTPATADDGDYFELVLKDYGIKTILSQFAVVHSTADSIVAVEDATTSVTTGTLTVTLGSVGGTDKKRVVTIRGVC